MTIAPNKLGAMIIIQQQRKIHQVPFPFQKWRGLRRVTDKKVAQSEKWLLTEQSNATGKTK